MLIHIEANGVPQNLYTASVIIYGGGSAGRAIYRLLSEKGVKITYIVDDNGSLHGEIFEGAEIVSFSRFLELNKERQNIAVVLGTIYGKSILAKIEGLPHVQIYEMYEWLEDASGNRQKRSAQFEDRAEVERLRVNLESLSPRWADEESRRVINGLLRYASTQNLADIAEICAAERQYFIPEVVKAVSHLKGMKIIDGGACWGDLLSSIRTLKLPLEKWYGFEADGENFKRLQRTVSALDSSEQQKTVCINKGLWSATGSVYFDGGQGTASRIVEHETSEKVEVISIDDYFRDSVCNFIKMDIEGAELEALKGAARTIERDRPIMAISIYHSLADFWRIPQWMIEHLSGYRYLVRHHSMIFSETVLYAIPDEL